MADADGWLMNNGIDGQWTTKAKRNAANEEMKVDLNLNASFNAIFGKFVVEPYTVHLLKFFCGASIE